MGERGTLIFPGFRGPSKSGPGFGRLGFVSLGNSSMLFLVIIPLYTFPVFFSMTVGAEQITFVKLSFCTIPTLVPAG